MRDRGIGFCRAVSVCLVLFALSSRAQLLTPQANEPPRPEITAAVSDFLSKLADGDVHGTLALFCGDSEQLELLDAQLAAVHSSALLEKAFPKILLMKPSLPVAIRRSVQDLGRRAVIVRGNRASISDGKGPLDLGMRLESREGKWLISHLVGRRAMTAGAIDLARAIVRVNKGLLADADAGKLMTGADVDRAVKAYAKPLQDLDHVRPVAMSAPPAGAEVEWKPPTVEAVASLPGAATPSDEVGRLFQSLPGLPCFTTEGRVISLTDEEAGIGYSATWKRPAAVQSVKLFARGAFGCAQYRGVLPDGLSFSDRRGDVEKKLGRPEMSFTEWNLYSAVYPALGLEITYQNPSGRDPNNVIHHITVTKPDRTAQRPNLNRGSSPRLTLHLVVDPVRGSGLGGLLGWGVAALTCVALIVLVCVRVGWRWPVAVTASVLCLSGLLIAAYVRSAPDVEGLPLGHTGLYYDVLRDAVVDERSIERVIVAIPSAGPRRASIEIYFTAEGAKALRRVSAAHIGRKLAIVLDGRIISAPVIDHAISDFVGSSAADSSTTVDEAWNLAGRLNAAVDSI